MLTHRGVVGPTMVKIKQSGVYDSLCRAETVPEIKLPSVAQHNNPSMVPEAKREKKRLSSKRDLAHKYPGLGKALKKDQQRRSTSKACMSMSASLSPPKTATIIPPKDLSSLSPTQTSDRLFLARLRGLEHRFPTHDYLSQQPGDPDAIQNAFSALEVGMVVDWMFEAMTDMGYHTGVVHLAVSTLHRYLCCVRVAKRALQLIAGTCIIIAVKYELAEVGECLKHIVYLCDGAWSPKQFIAAEAMILDELSFCVTVSTPVPHLRAGLRATGAVGCHAAVCTAHYLAELALAAPHMMKYPPSTIAAAAVYLTGLRSKDRWNRTAELVTCHTSNRDATRSSERLAYRDRAAPMTTQSLRQAALDLARVWWEVPRRAAGCGDMPHLHGKYGSGVYEPIPPSEVRW